MIDGIKLEILHERLQRADTLPSDLSTRACMTGTLRRRVRHHGRPYPDLGVLTKAGWELPAPGMVIPSSAPTIANKLASFEGQAVVLRNRSELRRFPAATTAREQLSERRHGLPHRRRGNHKSRLLVSAEAATPTETGLQNAIDHRTDSPANGQSAADPKPVAIVQR